MERVREREKKITAQQHKKLEKTLRTKENELNLFSIKFQSNLITLPFGYICFI
jgi:hypothetical protein